VSCWRNISMPQELRATIAGCQRAVIEHAIHPPCGGFERPGTRTATLWPVSESAGHSVQPPTPRRLERRQPLGDFNERRRALNFAVTAAPDVQQQVCSGVRTSQSMTCVE